MIVIRTKCRDWRYNYPVLFKRYISLDNEDRFYAYNGPENAFLYYYNNRSFMGRSQFYNNYNILFMLDKNKI